MKIKVSDLAGAQLDYWVAQAERIEVVLWANEGAEEGAAIVGPFSKGEFPNFYQPSKNWMLGGPIIERENVCMGRRIDKPFNWSAWIDLTFNGKALAWEMQAVTPLVAAMRVYVASKFGEEVEAKP